MVMQILACQSGKIIEASFGVVEYIVAVDPIYEVDCQATTICKYCIT